MGAGASAPFRLAREDKVLLVQAIDTWSTSVTVHGLPASVLDFRNAPFDDLRVVQA
jgi:hypothetical protein